MEPHRENIDVREAFEKTFLPNEVSSPNVKWSEENHCYILNGIEAPVPISAVKGVKNNEESASQSSMGESRAKMRLKWDKEFFFRLFKFPNAHDEQYLLEIHDKVKPDVIDRYRVFVCEKKGKWSITVHDLVLGDHVVQQILHDPAIPIFRKKYDIPLEDRLIGWRRETRLRDNGKENKFYYHRERQFRSFIEVITFVLYSCKAKDLIKVNRTKKIPQEVREFEAAEAMVTISSLNVTRNSFRK